jgi:hypothetical protein
MRTENRSVSALVATLNDVARTRIGNPWRGTYHTSVATDDAHEATVFAKILDSLGIVFQANYRRDKNARPETLLLTIYDPASQQRLLVACGDELREKRRAVLETLVRARRPVPDAILQKIQVTIEAGKSYAYIAERMNQLRIVDGMGGRGWTARKVRAKHEAHLEQLASELVPSSEVRSPR